MRKKMALHSRHSSVENRRRTFQNDTADTRRKTAKSGKRRRQHTAQIGVKLQTTPPTHSAKRRKTANDAADTRRKTA
jgi:hypothetical protein